VSSTIDKSTMQPIRTKQRQHTSAQKKVWASTRQVLSASFRSLLSFMASWISWNLVVPFARQIRDPVTLPALGRFDETVSVVI
jgi:hypothetical protein